MPLRDHFHSPVSDLAPWQALHGAWPTLIVLDLNRRLPRRYAASPRLYVGNSFEIDVAATDLYAQSEPSGASEGSNGGGGVATAVWAPPEPTLAVETDLPMLDEFEVQVFDRERRRLVAAVELVSPANKDRPEHRRAFAAKGAALLQQGASVTLVDPVTARRANLSGGRVASNCSGPAAGRRRRRGAPWRPRAPAEPPGAAAPTSATRPRQSRPPAAAAATP